MSKNDENGHNFILIISKTNSIHNLTFDGLGDVLLLSRDSDDVTVRSGLWQVNLGLGLVAYLADVGSALADHELVELLEDRDLKRERLAELNTGKANTMEGTAWSISVV